MTTESLEGLVNESLTRGEHDPERARLPERGACGIS